MVKITNGIVTVEVTSGAFDSVYSKQGFHRVVDVAPIVGATERELTADEKWLAEIAEKPLSQWSKDEVKRFATLKELDITGTKNVSEAKALIKAVLEQ